MRLILRFDEFGDTSKLVAKVPVASTKNLDGISSPRSPLTASIDASAPPGVTRYVLGFPGASPATSGPQDQSVSTDGLTYDVVLIPKSCAWMQNGLQHAATVNAAIKYIDCPIDPRLVRSVGVEVYLGCVTEDLAQQQNMGIAPAGPVLPSTFTGPLGEQRTNLRFQGFATKFKAEWGKGEPVITLDAQDNSVLLHNQEMSPRLVVSMTKPLDLAVADFLANYVQLAGLTVQYLPSTDTPPVLSDVLSGTAFRPNLGPPASKGGGASKLSIWDYLTDVCGSCAHTIRMDGTTIIIQRARSLLTNAVSPRADDPFRPRTVDGVSFNFRRYIYGRNLKEYSVERNFTKKTVQNIECFPGDVFASARDIERGYRRWYDGPATTVSTLDGRHLTSTPKHPVLTRRGWVAQGDIVKGDDLICCRLEERVSLADPHVDAAPTEIAKLFDSLQDARDPERVPAREVYLHGDRVDADVEVVTAGSLLVDRDKTPRLKHLGERLFKAANVWLQRLARLGSRFLLPHYQLSRQLATSCGGVGFGERFSVEFNRRVSPSILGGTCPIAKDNAIRQKVSHEHACGDAGLLLELHDGRTFFIPASDVGDGRTNLASSSEPGLGLCPELNTPSNQDRLDAAAGEAWVLLHELVDRGAVEVTTDKVIGVAHGEFSGHVFNLQTASGWYVANGIIVHNCRSYLTEKKTVLVGRFPQLADRQVYALPGNTTPDEKWSVYNVPGIKDQPTLTKIAQGIYEQISRQELGVSLVTKSLGSFGGSNVDPDILDMKVGDTFELLVNRDSDEVNTLTSMETALTAQGQNAALMLQLGFSQGFADAYAKAYTNANFTTTYRLKTMKIEWTTSGGAGVTLSINGMNYIEVRGDQFLPPGQEPSNSAMQPAVQPKDPPVGSAT